jgi:nuclear mRNA export protein SAC3
MPNETTGRDMPAEERMVKRFRRSAAGYDEQLPSDIRTPATLQATLNYLLDDVIDGSERLAAVHKFVWDRTRGIRNDFSIQQVSKDEDVRFAVDCFEKIARFHILSLHQLSNPDNLTGEGFDAHQEREQLNNTLLSLMYYYDDNHDKQQFPNEAEFRAYCIIFELQSSHPDLEDRMQSWPPQLLNDKRVQTAFRLYSAATNTLFEQGPLKPTAPFSIAQGNSGAFWKLLKSKAVSYMMSCIAEIYFSQIRYMTLQNLWESHKGPSGQQIRNQEWTLHELTDALAFDDDEETLEFCQGYGLEFKTRADGIHHLDFTSQASPLDRAFPYVHPIAQSFIFDA